MIPLPGHAEAGRIIRASGSSFTAALLLLPGDRRADARLFYAFCRTVDDVADGGGEAEPRQQILRAWREAFRDPHQAAVPKDLRDLMARRSIDPALFVEILEGMIFDAAPRVRLADAADLRRYCHQVAGAVGLACLPIFGADPLRSSAYAEALGLALQLTNILRDLREDAARNRVYLPEDLCRRHGVDPDGILRAPADALAAARRELAAQAMEAFASASRLLPPRDRAALRPARVMQAVYGDLFQAMARHGWLLPPQRVALPRWRKLWQLARVLAGRDLRPVQSPLAQAVAGG